MKHDEVQRIDQLFKEVAAKGLSRRQMIQRAAVLGISAPALTVAFVQQAHLAVAQGDDNPLGVDPDLPLDVVIFAGGYGDDYAVNVNENIWPRFFPDSEITYAGTQRLQEQYQSRVVEGSPPDIMNNSGAGNFNNTTLFNDGQLASLDDLMAAPAFGQEDITFAESLTPGTQTNGVFEGSQYVLHYVMSVYGMWHNTALFEEKGWEYPQTWDAFLDLCQEIQDEGEMAPFTYQGLYPYYIRAVWEQLVFKSGGWDAQLKLDNLAEDAWTQPVAVEAMDAIQQLYNRGFILEGTEGLSHTESQTAWIEGEAAFLPCGAWLENEMSDLLSEIPEFTLRVDPVPSLTADDVLPFETIQASAGENFIVFANGANVQGGKEWIRLLFSQEGSAFFSEATRNVSVVTGAAEGLDLGSAFASVEEAILNAGDNTFVGRWGGWYEDLNEQSQITFNELMTGVITPEEASETMQAENDAVRENPDIPKFELEDPRG